MQDIAKYFAKAGVELTLSNKPIINSRLNNGTTDKIFQMTIDSGKKERFRIFKGVDNDVRVLDYDKKKNQVLLFVKEPKRTFTTVEYDRTSHKNIETTRTTPDFIRRYLMGKDETHLFISELPDGQGKINDISDAHRSLRPFEVKDRKKRKSVKIKRQGEWFFIEATPSELIDINANIKFVEQRKSLPIEQGGNAHIVEYLLKIDEVIFIKGKVRHADHHTQEFLTWQRVFKNTEKRDNNARFGRWVD